MTDTNFTFRQFRNIEEAEEISALLNENGVDSHVIESKLHIDPYQLDTASNKQFEVFIKPEDIEKAEQVLLLNAEKLVEEVDPDHYLYSFTDDELRDIIQKPDEWNAFDFALARKLLAEKGLHYDQDGLSQLKKERTLQLTEPEKAKTVWIVVGYLFTLIMPILGMLIGWSFWKTKKTLPDGNRVLNYRKEDRQHGQIMFYVSLIGVILVFFKLLIKTGNHPGAI